MAPAEVAVEGVGTLQRRQFHLGATAHEICANDNVKGVGIKHFAVLRHLFIAHIYGHIHPSQQVDASTIPYPYGHDFAFPDHGLLWQSACHD